MKIYHHIRPHVKHMPKYSNYNNFYFLRYTHFWSTKHLFIKRCSSNLICLKEDYLLTQKCCVSGIHIFRLSFLNEQKEIERFSNLFCSIFKVDEKKEVLGVQWQIFIFISFLSPKLLSVNSFQNLIFAYRYVLQKLQII